MQLNACYQKRDIFVNIFFTVLSICSVLDAELKNSK